MMETAVQKTRLPIMGSEKQPKIDEALEAELRAFEEAERERLGIKAERKQWVDNMLNPEVKRSERENVTLLISGLTAAQDFLVEGALGGLGYKIKNIGCPDQEGLQVGKEFGNRGQCNPTYFTVGNLVNYLIKLRDEQGLTSEEVVKNYVFLTAGACGPCRFGMYVTEYRKALRDAGFDGFRVMLFQQTGGLSQATGDDVGIDMNPAFFVGIVKGIVCGDVLNALGYRIRPYEVVPGATNKALEEAKRIIYTALHDQTNVFVALYKCRKLFEAIEVDRLRVRAKASIIGEFWAMTTEGDGNYQLQKFLESEGAENDIQLTTAWLLYNVWEVRHDTQDRMELRGVDDGTYALKEHQGEFDVAKRIATMRLAETALKVGFQAFAQPIGLHDYHLPDMDLVAKVAEDYYSNDLRGGEGHMEVGKLIVNTVRAKAHITVSVKPFGCMPSSGVSDGVQSLITGKYPGTIFCAVETSGDGATNFYSRIQMYMFKARIAAEQELERVLAEQGVTIEEVRAFLDANPKYKSALYYPPHRVAGTAANLVYVVAPLIKKSAAERAIDKAKHAAEALKDAAVAAPGAIAEVYRKATDPETITKVREDALVLKDIVRGKAMERFRPLLEQLMGKAVFENNPEIRTTTYEPIAAE
ncbi:2-hydroxyglutaryl-CoA dehydratase [Polyangium spumosum]|uniref:2-hydroxyglutaryl-CoA dehydratase n=2 Tax=Polyangium spumosum TaxID=889282 RepID=A0A6N7PWR9_9BACT|nr:2-hydroxyglutaryl-CoA dehydratase [Polyangium spumosum]